MGWPRKKFPLTLSFYSSAVSSDANDENLVENDIRSVVCVYVSRTKAQMEHEKVSFLSKSTKVIKWEIFCCLLFDILLMLSTGKAIAKNCSLTRAQSVKKYRDIRVQ